MKFLKVLMVAALLLVPISVSVAETTLAPAKFVNYYVHVVHHKVDPQMFSNLWYQRARDNLHDTEDRLQKEVDLSLKIHAVVIADGALSNAPEVSSWGDDADTHSFDYNLNKPLTTEQVHEAIGPEMGGGPDTVWDTYQITIEKENGNWVVSGESLVGTG